jgi:hypothetical protein
MNTMCIFISRFILIFFLFTGSILSHTILLKSGAHEKGIVTNQEGDSIQIITESGESKSFLKSSILKVIYRDLPEEEIIKVRQKEEQKLINLKKEKEERTIETEKKNIDETVIDDKIKNKDEIVSEDEIKNKESNLLIKSEKSNNQTPYFFLNHLEKNCKPYSSMKQWFWLYGNFPFSNDPWQSILPQESSSINIRYTSTWSDTLISVLAGGFTSISRKTLTIDICDLDPNLIQSSQEEVQNE